METNTGNFFTTMQYYYSLWKVFDKNILKNLLSNNVSFSFTALDEPDRHFQLNGKDDVLNNFYDKWFATADGKNTQIKNLSIDCIQNNMYKVSYCIKQRHLNNNHWLWYDFVAIEIITLEDSGLISDIKLIRIKKNYYPS